MCGLKTRLIHVVYEDLKVRLAPEAGSELYYWRVEL